MKGKQMKGRRNHKGKRFHSDPQAADFCGLLPPWIKGYLKRVLDVVFFFLMVFI
jgi:hypothetical protein